MDGFFEPLCNSKLLHQRKQEVKAKEEATLNVAKNESEKGFAQDQNIELQILNQP